MRGRAALLAAALAWLAAAAPPTAAGGQRLSSEAVAELARRFALERFGAELAGATLEPLAPPREIALPAGPVTTTLSLQAGSPAAGHLIVLVEASVPEGTGGRAERSATVAFRVQASQEAVVAVRELARGSLVRAEDLRLERRPADRLPRGAASSPAAVVGREVLRAVAPGEVVTAAAVAPPRAVRRGSPVSLVLEGRGFRIVARGVAAEDGAVGETIRVVNQISRRELSGTVEDERTVRVAW
jgi:flagella basal body P-ring formation protein FlgA